MPLRMYYDYVDKDKVESGDGDHKVLSAHWFRFKDIIDLYKMDVLRRRNLKVELLNHSYSTSVGTHRPVGMLVDRTRNGGVDKLIYRTEAVRSCGGSLLMWCGANNRGESSMPRRCGRGDRRESGRGKGHSSGIDLQMPSRLPQPARNWPVPVQPAQPLRYYVHCTQYSTLRHTCQASTCGKCLSSWHHSRRTSRQRQSKLHPHQPAPPKLAPVHRPGCHLPSIL